MKDMNYNLTVKRLVAYFYAVNQVIPRAMKITPLLLLTGISVIFAESSVARSVDASADMNKKQVIAVQQQSEKKITGTVVDANGETLIGVNVMVKGKAGVGAVTDINGNFSLKVDDNATIMISYIGYLTQEIVVAGKHSFTIKLVEDARALDEVVVVGYGTQIKRNVSTAISSVSAEKLGSVTAALNPAQALVGQVSGVRLQQTSGAPGAAPVIRIRGAGSITNGNDPLYVIDGFPTNDANLFASILPSDVASIDILKDAAAAAIYGSRAGNGVVIITTKRGKTGKTQFTVDINVGFEDIVKRYELCGADEFAELAIEDLTYNNKPIPSFLTDKSRWVETDWQDAIFRKALFQKYQISATGGTDKVKYSLSGGYVDQQGTILNSYMKRYNFRLAFDANLSKKVRVGVNISPSYTESRNQNPGGSTTDLGASGIIAEALLMPPMIPVYKENGDHLMIYQDPELVKVFNWQVSNPVNKLEANHDYSRDFRQTANAYLEIEPIERLKIRSTFNTSIVAARRDIYVSGILANRNHTTGNISTPNLNTVSASRKASNALNWYWSNTASYDWSIKDNNFTFLLGYDVSQTINYEVEKKPRTDADITVAFDNFVVQNVEGALLSTGNSNLKEYVFDAVFGRINYNYKGKYLFSASLRQDRSSKFGPRNRKGVFPSVSAAWNIADESFMNPVEWFSALKVRASYGETGNDQLKGYYDWMATMKKTYTVLGQGSDNRVIGYEPSGFSNYDLGWEKNKQYDIGLEVSFLNNKISFLADWYVRNSNTILSSEVPSINGKVGSIIQNIGQVRNKGVEFSINTHNISGAFTWKTDFNISFNKNEIIELALDQEHLGHGWAGSYWGGVHRNYVGRPMSDLYMYKSAGTFNNQEDLDKYAKLGNQNIGDVRYEDVAGGEDGGPDGKINADDMQYVGNANPDFVFGFGNTFSYKGFDLNILLDGVYGGKLINSLERGFTLNRYLENVSAKSARDRWRSEENPGSGYSHRAGSRSLGSQIGPNDRFLYDASFLRIRNISLGYTLPASISKKLSTQSLRLHCSILNLHTFSEFSGYDPEGNHAGGNATRGGVSQGTYPVARNVTFGLTVNF